MPASEGDVEVRYTLGESVEQLSGMAASFTAMGTPPAEARVRV